jgi:hypothetical protein
MSSHLLRIINLAPVLFVLIALTVSGSPLLFVLGCFGWILLILIVDFVTEHPTVSKGKK